MSNADQIRDEQHFREVERAMLYVDDAARKVAETAETLKQDGASPHLVDALEAAAGSIRADHRRLIKSVYWKAPEKSDPQAEIPADEDQERLAS